MTSLWLKVYAGLLLMCCGVLAVGWGYGWTGSATAAAGALVVAGVIDRAVSR